MSSTGRNACASLLAQMSTSYVWVCRCTGLPGDGFQSDCAVLARASAYHAEQVRPSRHIAIRPVCAVVQGDYKLLPLENLAPRKVFCKSHVSVSLRLLDVDVPVSKQYLI